MKTLFGALILIAMAFGVQAFADDSSNAQQQDNTTTTVGAFCMPPMTPGC